MSGLNHDFLLLSRSAFDYWDYLKLINRPEAVSLHNDLLEYLLDSLRWIPCHNPGHGKRKGLLPHNGLNFYGPTIIKSDGGHVFHRIFDAWGDLFSNGPSRLELLTKTSGWIEGESAESGAGHTIIADRDDVVKRLRQLADFGKKVEESAGELYILHLGI